MTATQRRESARQAHHSGQRLDDALDAYAGAMFSSFLCAADRRALCAIGRTLHGLASKVPGRAYLAALTALLLAASLTLAPSLLPSAVLIALVAGVLGMARVVREALRAADVPVAAVAAPTWMRAGEQWVCVYLGANVPAPLAVPVGGDIVVPAGRLAAPAARYLVLARCGMDDIPLSLVDTPEDAVAACRTVTPDQIVQAARAVLDAEVSHLIAVGYVRFKGTRASRYVNVRDLDRDGITVPPGRLAAPQGHTPGRWEVRREGDLLGIFAGDYCLNGMAVSEATSGQLHRDGLPMSEAEIVADFRLIAAAPDLLAACESAVQFIRNGIDFGYIRRPEEGSPEAATLPALLAAVERARGEQAITVPPGRLAAPTHLAADLAGVRVLLCPLPDDWMDLVGTIRRWQRADPHLHDFGSSMFDTGPEEYAAVKARLLAEAMDRAGADAAAGVR